MAKLYTEITSHGNARTIKRGDNTRIMVDAYHKNTFLGSFEMYHVQPNDTVNILWRPNRGGFGSEIMLVEESKQLK